jgi:hypothetical protein
MIKAAARRPFAFCFGVHMMSTAAEGPND